MKKIVEFLKPVVIGYLTSPDGRKMLVEILEQLVESTENEIDDALVDGLRRALQVEE